MAPNLNLYRPSEETLIPPAVAQGEASEHGTHRVISTYGKLQRDDTSGGQLPTARPSPDRQNHGQEQVARQSQGGLSLTSRQQTQGQQERLRQAHRHQQEKLAKMLMPSSSPMEGKSMEDILGDDSKELLPKFLETLGLLRDGDVQLPQSLRDILSPRDETPRPQSTQNQNVYDHLLRSPGAANLPAFSTQTQNMEGTELKGTQVKSSAPASGKAFIPSPTTYRPHQTVSKGNITPLPLQREQQNRKPFVSRRRLPPPSSTPRASSANEQQPSSLVKEVLVREEPRLGNGDERLKEELADFSNLFHHEKSRDELAKGGQDVTVREEWLFTSEGATAVILVGMCSLIMMLICFIFVMKRWRGHGSSKGKKDYVEEEKSQDFHKSQFGTDFNIPGFAHLPFIHSLIHHHDPSPKIDPSPHDIIDVEKEMSKTQLGRIWFSVRYDDEKSDLHVNILHARYPNGRGVTSTTGELWVEGVILSPMNTVKATSKTSSRRATSSPVFNHSFLFLLQKDDVKSFILKLTLHDNHPKTGEEVVGSIILPFSSIDLSSDEIYCRDLL